MTGDHSFPESFGSVTSLTLIHLAKSADPAACGISWSKATPR